MKTCIRVNRGDEIGYDGDVCKVLDVVLVPSGISDLTLVALVYAERRDGSRVSATAGNFEVLEDGVGYEEFFPGGHFETLEAFEDVLEKV
jgi:hypothetical protein